MPSILRRLPVFSCALIAALATAAPRAAEASFIDFRTPAFSTADNDPSFSTIVDGIGLQFDPIPQSARLYWDSTDGFGVRYSYEEDEIEGTERLKITFTTGPVYLLAVSLTDLFREGSPAYWETGEYSINGGAWISFVQNDPTQLPSPVSNGEFELLVNATGVSTIKFRAPGKIMVNGKEQNHEYSVAGVTLATPVPEPGTLVLLLAGTVGVFSGHRRRTGHKTSGWNYYVPNVIDAP
jgi:hypothetical protein